jgi:hypothetical protein
MDPGWILICLLLLGQILLLFVLHMPSLVMFLSFCWTCRLFVLVAAPVPQKALAFVAFPSSQLHLVSLFPSIILGFLGRVPFQDEDLDNCWNCAGMLKTACVFYSDTAEKHASPAPA